MDLDNVGLINLRKVYWNLPTEALYEEIIFRGEGRISQWASACRHRQIHCTELRMISSLSENQRRKRMYGGGSTTAHSAPETFDDLYAPFTGFSQGRDLFVQDCYGGSDPNYRFLSASSLNMLGTACLPERCSSNLKRMTNIVRHIPEFTLLCVPSFKSFPQIDGTLPIHL